MGAIHLNKQDQRVLLLVLRRQPLITQEDVERAERLARALSQYELEDE